MNIYIDGIIYSLQKTGGISRYFNELINNISNDNALEILLHKNIKGVLPQSSNIKFKFNASLPNIRPRRIFNPLINYTNNTIKNHYWSKPKKGIFHSTYFTTYQKLKIPQILTVYDMIHEKFPQYFSDNNSLNFIKQKKKCIDAADAIICISESTKQDLINYYNIDKNKVFVTYLGSSKEFKLISNENIKKVLLQKYNIIRPFLLFVGNRGLYKNFNLFLSAFSSLNINELTIVTVGGGDFNENEKKIIEGLNIKNKVYNLGFISDEDLNILYNCASVFVFPSLYEGFGIPLLEAMACGAPIVASNTSSLPEIAGNAALYFNPYNVNDMAKIIKQAVTVGRSSKYTKLGLERVKMFSWDKTARETFNIYKNIYKQYYE